MPLLALDFAIFAEVMIRLSLIFLVPAMLGGWMGRKRIVGAGAGFLIGLFLSYFGPLILLFFPVTVSRVRCPHCDERIRPAAKVCPYCRQPVAIEPEFDD